MSTAAEFDEHAWHDCHIWGFDLRAGSADEGDWTSDLVLDIDYIVEWLCAPKGRAQFRVAPATLTFHGVTDLRIDITWTPPGSQVSLHPISIARIERAAIQNQRVFLDRPYYSFRIVCNWPDGGEIAFGATGFTLTLDSEAVLVDEQALTLSMRRRTPGRAP
jgi:hypothetical protein